METLVSKLKAKLRVAVYLDQKMTTGGGYQQVLNIASRMKDISEDTCEIVFVTCIPENIPVLSKLGIQARPLTLSFIAQVGLRLRRVLDFYPLSKLLRKVFGFNVFELFFVKLDIDLVYFTSPSEHFLDLERLNYIFTVWDLCHRDDPEFPEVRDYGQFEHRESIYANALKKAVGVFVDSDVGKENIVLRYQLDDSRVHVLPFSPANWLRGTDAMACDFNVKQKYQLAYDYVVYPAQFWPHKNHIYLLQGLKALEQEYGKKIGALFVGGTSNSATNLEYIRHAVKELGLVDRVRFTGFLPDEDMACLYLQSMALVMPTYFGPTNLPPLEAFFLGVPVLYPDKKGLREQVGNAALLMDLNNPMSMASHINEILIDVDLKPSLIAAGYRRLDELQQNANNDSILQIIEDFAVRRRSWC